IGARECVLDAAAGTGEVLFAAGRERFATFPEGERVVEVQAALFEHLHDIDEFVAGALVAETGDLGEGVGGGGLGAGIGHGQVLFSSVVFGVRRWVPRAAAETAPSATRIRSWL